MKRLMLIGLSCVCLCLFAMQAMGQNATETGAGQEQQQEEEAATAPEAEEAEEAEEEVVEVSMLGDEEMIGGIDWDNKVVYAVGGGAPPKNAVNSAQKRLLAKRAAIDEAYARLLESIQEVLVDAESTTQDMINKNRTVNVKVRGMIKNAEIYEIKQYSDGSYQVKMKMPLTGGNGLSSALLPVQMANVRQTKVVGHVKQSFPTQTKSKTAKKVVVSKKKAKKEQPEETEEQAAAESEDSMEVATDHTSLIVNAKGLGAKEALYPVIKTQDGSVVYNLDMVNPNDAVEAGMCAYKHSLEKARNMPLAGDNPLVVDAVEVGGKYKADIILSEDDGLKVATADEYGEFLGGANVIVVLD